MLAASTHDLWQLQLEDAVRQSGRRLGGIDFCWQVERVKQRGRRPLGAHPSVCPRSETQLTPDDDLPRLNADFHFLRPEIRHLCGHANLSFRLPNLYLDGMNQF